MQNKFQYANKKAPFVGALKLKFDNCYIVNFFKPWVFVALLVVKTRFCYFVNSTKYTQFCTIFLQKSQNLTMSIDIHPPL